MENKLCLCLDFEIKYKKMLNLPKKDIIFAKIKI